MQPFLKVNFGADHAGKKINTHQIVLAISNQIKETSSLSGCRLPPIRALAHQLGVSKNTVSSAYDELKSQDLVESRGKTGLFVTTSRIFPTLKKKRSVPIPALKALPFLNQPVIKKGQTVVSSVFIDPKLLPKERIADCMRSVLKNPGLQDYSDRQGYYPLRKLIADRLHKRGITTTAECIVLTVGSLQVIDLVCRSLKSNTIGTESPAFYVGKASMEMNGHRVFGLPINPFQGIDPKLWEKLLKKHKPSLLYLTTNYQNPSGYSYTSQELAWILEWASKYEIGILEDDWGSEMLSYSEFRPSLRALGGENIFYMNSFTKKLLPSLRVGYVVANEQTVQHIKMAKAVSTSGSPGFVEQALFEFLDRGYYDSHLKKVQAELDLRYQNCLNLLRTYMPEFVKWTSPGGGPVLWLELPKSVLLSKLVARMLEKNYVIQTSQEAFFGTPHLNGFKLGYAFLEPIEMQMAIETLAEEIKKLS